ncbi:hypothetical protein MSIBF_A2910003 [groundwater metagenome]|uniref:Uncharacterized protein n=1 Tax=groundwater metagenome TaxID=717931 RepID=A0A098EA88_9ZZZZ
MKENHSSPYSDVLYVAVSKSQQDVRELPKMNSCYCDNI